MFERVGEEMNSLACCSKRKTKRLGERRVVVVVVVVVQTRVVVVVFFVRERERERKRDVPFVPRSRAEPFDDERFPKELWRSFFVWVCTTF